MRHNMLSILAFQVNRRGSLDPGLKMSQTVSSQSLPLRAPKPFQRGRPQLRAGIQYHAIIIAFITILCAFMAVAQDETKQSARTADNILEEPGRLFNIKVPKDFKAAPLEVPGIIKWKKDQAEIYLVVGDNFSKSKKKTFDALYKATKKDKRYEKVDRVNIRGGKAFVFKEKAPKEPTRLRTWRLVVVTDNKIIHVDFSAPGKDFNSYIDQFEAALKSFKLRSSDS
jgi:hypothetical protein